MAINGLFGLLSAVAPSWETLVATRVGCGTQHPSATEHGAVRRWALGWA
jgi:hypothetical protein